MFDPVTADPTLVDWQNPTANAAVAFESGGERVLGVFYLAQGAGLHPTVILLHGIPGYERNFDLAQALRRAGWQVLAFHYRGAWGSGGSFSFAHAVEDVGAALEFVRNRSSRDAYHIDTQRIVLIGHSLGAFAALMTAIPDPQIRAIVSLTPYDLGAVVRLIRTSPADAGAVRRFLEWTMLPLQGTSPKSLIDELLDYGDRWSLPLHAAPLADRSHLVIDVARDSIAPPELHSLPFIQALKANHAQALTHLTLDTDHAFTNARIALMRSVVDWLGALSL